VWTFHRGSPVAPSFLRVVTDPALLALRHNPFVFFARGASRRTFPPCEAPNCHGVSEICQGTRWTPSGPTRINVPPVTITLTSMLFLYQV